jgi:hypothetical protein
MGREISHVMGHLGARWLERPDRVREELPERVVAAMAVEPSAEVADIGAGDGCFVPAENCLQFAAPTLPGRLLWRLSIRPRCAVAVDRRHLRIVLIGRAKRAAEPQGAGAGLAVLASGGASSGAALLAGLLFGLVRQQDGAEAVEVASHNG